MPHTTRPPTPSFTLPSPTTALHQMGASSQLQRTPSCSSALSSLLPSSPSQYKFICMASETSTSNMVSQTYFQMPSSFATCSGASATQGCFPDSRLPVTSSLLWRLHCLLHLLRPPHALGRLLVVFFVFLQNSELLDLQHRNALQRSEGYHLLSSKMDPFR